MIQLNTYIDHTILKPTLLVEEVEKLCSEAIEYKFIAVCIPPNFIKIAKQCLENSAVKISTVIGFPFGYSSVEAKVAEIILAIVDGVDELDIVINISAIKNKDWTFLTNEINTIMPIIHNKNKVAKIIIESGVLTDEEIIKCCDIYSLTGIHFLKTSTGYAESGASLHVVQLFKKYLPNSIQIKASGGIKDIDFTMQLIQAGANRIGTSKGLQIMNQYKNSFNESKQ